MSVSRILQVTNTTGQTVTFRDKRFSPGETYEIIAPSLNIWRDDPTVSGAIASGTLQVSDADTTFTEISEALNYFYDHPLDVVERIQTADGTLVSGTVTFSGVGLVNIEPVGDNTLHVSTPDAASLFELVIVSGTLQEALVVATGVVLDLVDDIESPASTAQGGFIEIDETLSTTTSTTFQEKISLTGDLTAVFSGTDSQPFRLQWYYEWGYSSAASNINTQITVDDVDTVGIIEWRPTAVSATDFAASSGYIDMTLSSGTHFFDIDFRSGQSGKTARIQRVRMALVPLTLGRGEDEPPAHGI